MCCVCRPSISIKNAHDELVRDVDYNPNKPYQVVRTLSSLPERRQMCVYSILWSCVYPHAAGACL